MQAPIVRRAALGVLLIALGGVFPAAAIARDAQMWTSTEGNMLFIQRSGRTKYEVTLSTPDGVRRIACHSVLAPVLPGHSPDNEPRAAFGLALSGAGHRAMSGPSGPIWSYNDTMSMVDSIPVLGPGICVAGLEVSQHLVVVTLGRSAKKGSWTATLTGEQAVVAGELLMK